MKTINNNIKCFFLSDSNYQPFLLSKIKNSLHKGIKDTNKKVSAHISSKNKSFIIINGLINTIDTNIKVFPSFHCEIMNIPHDITPNTAYIGGRSLKIQHYGCLIIYRDLQLPHIDTFQKRASDFQASHLNKEKDFYNGCC